MIKLSLLTLMIFASCSSPTITDCKYVKGKIIAKRDYRAVGRGTTRKLVIYFESNKITETEVPEEVYIQAAVNSEIDVLVCNNSEK